MTDITPAANTLRAQVRERLFEAPPVRGRKYIIAGAVMVWFSLLWMAL